MSTNPTETRTLAVIEEDTSPTRYAGIDRGQLELLKRTIAKGTTDDEFALFMNTAMRLKLDPFAKQIYAVKRYDFATKTEVMATQVAIDGYRAVAEDTGECDGRDGPFWCDEDGAWKEVWTSVKPPAAAKVVVYRKGVSRPYVGVASYKSYVQKNKDGGPRATWATMPDVMLGKCAEAQALRAAFPKQLSGTHGEGELDQADGDRDPAADMTKLPATTTIVPTASAQVQQAQPPKTPADTWPAFVADLAALVAKVPDMAEHVIGNADVSTWVEKDVEAAIAWMLDEAKTAEECNDRMGPWIQFVSKHAGASATSRVAIVKAGFHPAYMKRMADLRAAAKAKQGSGAPA